jgi:hypothetical protein
MRVFEAPIVCRRRCTPASRSWMPSETFTGSTPARAIASTRPTWISGGVLPRASASGSNPAPGAPASLRGRIGVRRSLIEIVTPVARERAGSRSHCQNVFRARSEPAPIGQARPHVFATASAISSTVTVEMARPVKPFNSGVRSFDE